MQAPSLAAAHSKLAASVTAGSLPGITLRPSLPSGSIPISVATGDFNGDKKLDRVVANGGDNSVDVYLGNGDGTSALPHIINLTGQSPSGVAVGDVNGDGKLDVVVAEADSGTVGVLLGNGDGTFRTEFEIALPLPPLAISVADINNDGHPDIVIGVEGDGTSLEVDLAVLLNNGSGQFSPPIFAPTPNDLGQPLGWNLSVGDVNNDGNLDVLVTGGVGGEIQVQLYTGNGDGTFDVGELVDSDNGGSPDRQPLNAILADVDGDGCVDAVDVDTYGLVHIFHGDCKGDFDETNFLVYGVGDPGYGLAVADLNGDGHPDIITGGIPIDVGLFGSVSGNTITVILNDGTGHFGPARVYQGDPALVSLAVADLSSTGHPDIISANQNANSVSVFLNDGNENFGPPMGSYDGFETGTPASPANAPYSGYVVADVNGDGKPDLAVIQYGPNLAAQTNLAVMLNEGAGKFAPPVLSPATPSGWVVSDFVFADFRKSGLPDFLCLVWSGGGQIQLLYARNLGNGQFAAATQIPIVGQAGQGLGAIGVGDFNKDGHLDFAVAAETGSETPDQLTVYLGQGDGTFTGSAPINFGPPSTEPWPVAVFVGDANGDGKPDIFVTTYLNVEEMVSTDPEQGRDLFELLGNGDGTFQPATEALMNVSAMTMADVNHDGKLDVLDVETAPYNNSDLYSAGAGSPRLLVYLCTSNGGFSAPTTYAPFGGLLDSYYGSTVTQQTHGNLAGWFDDFNGDGNLDFAAYQQSSLETAPAYLQFLMGNSDGTFTPTFDVYNLGIQSVPDLTIPNLLGDGRGALLQTPSFTSSYFVFPPISAPAFQIKPDEVPVLNNKDVLEISVNVPSNSETAFALSASDPGVQLPATATLAAGQTSVAVPFTLNASTTPNQWFSITAKTSGSSASTFDFPGRPEDSFTQVVQPPPIPTLQPGGPSELFSAGVQANGDASATFVTTCVGLPASLTCQFSNGVSTFAVPADGTEGVLFAVLAAPSAEAGPYSFNVVATDGEIILSTPAQVQVTSATPISLNPVQLAFSSVLDGSTSATQSLTVSNPSLTAVSPTIVPPANSSPQIGTFSESNNCGASLAAGASCTIQVAFTAKSPGSVTDSVSVQWAQGSASSALSGNAGDVALQVAPGSAFSVTVAPGFPGTFNLQVAPTSFTGDVTISCSSPAPMTQCSVSNGDVYVAGNATVPFQVTVATAAGSSLGKVAGTSPPSGRKLFGYLILFSALAVCYFGWTRSGWLRAGTSAARVALFLTLLIAIASCGGGNSGGGGGGSSGTPRGTYTVTVDGAVGSATRSLQVTLIVN